MAETESISGSNAESMAVARGFAKGVYQSTVSCTLSMGDTILSDGGGILSGIYGIAQFYFWDIPAAVCGNNEAEYKLIKTADSQDAIMAVVANIDTIAPKIFQAIPVAMGSVFEKFKLLSPAEQSAKACGIIGHYVFALLTTKGAANVGVYLKGLSTEQLASELAESVLPVVNDLNKTASCTMGAAAANFISTAPDTVTAFFKSSPAFLRLLNASEFISPSGGAVGAVLLDRVTKANRVLRYAHVLISDGNAVRLTLKYSDDLATSNGIRDFVQFTKNLLQRQSAVTGATQLPKPLMQVLPAVAPQGQLTTFTLDFEKSEATANGIMALVQALSGF